MTTTARSVGKSVLIAIIVVWATALPAALVGAREVTDMTGRKATIPDTIRKVYAPSPYGAHALYSIDPALVCGLIFPSRTQIRNT